MNDPDLAGRHILIIEDEHIVAQAMCRMLRVWGASVIGPAATVDAALALVRSTPRIDGVLLDINLRGVRAFAVADELIERHIPLVFATGYSDPTIPERYRHVGVLQKPFGPEDIARALFPIVGHNPPGPAGQ
jgi:CheY-like chemotaxis protein